MSLHVTDKELQKLIDRIGYKGCKNCNHQISLLRGCKWLSWLSWLSLRAYKWLKRGGDGQIHFLCPMWDEKEGSNKE